MKSSLYCDFFVLVKQEIHFKWETLKGQHVIDGYNLVLNYSEFKCRKTL
jgi:DNA-binding protein Fis